MTTGAFDMSNTMSGSMSSSAGIVQGMQNSGMNAMLQQGVTVMATVNVGK